MKKILLIIALLACQKLYAQNTIKFVIKDDNTKQPLIGATAFIKATKQGKIADTVGTVTLSNLPNGPVEITFSFVGYLSAEKTYTFPLKSLTPQIEIFLEPLAGELAEVMVQTTRTNQNIKDIPTRIEALPQEELDEKSTMRPGDIKMLMGEATGVQAQQTSAVSGTANFRIQGLDSRYTQLLKDGMPLYQGFSGGLSLMQITPLDLKQVEFIKGSASTLFGGGAIAGLVNLISKSPADKPELTVLLNGNTAKGVDADAYYSQKWKHIGTTIFTSYNYNGAYAPDNTPFTAIPQTNRFSINPKVFFYINDKDSGWIGVNAAFENRFGGDINVVNGHADNVHQYFERNKSNRVSTQLSFTHKIDSLSQLNFKNTLGYFDRTLTEPGYDFSGKQTSSYSELNYVYQHNKVNWVAGADVWTDNLTVPAPLNYLSYTLNTFGLFAQNTYKASSWFSIESGLRADYNDRGASNRSNGIFVLPRVNALFKLDQNWTSRIGGGLGYKMPTIFNDQTEEEGYNNIRPVALSTLKAEQSYGLNADINYRGAVGDAVLTFNQLFFYTRVNDPLLLTGPVYANAPGYLTTDGGETNAKLLMDDIGFYLGYTYTDTKQHFNGITATQPLTPKNRISADVTYEIENSFRAGVEGFYNSAQLLSDGTTGRGYWTYGLLVQKMWKHLDIYINAENMTDRRQTRWDTIYTGTITNPVFRDIYAPLDGVVVNAGVRIKIL